MRTAWKVFKIIRSNRLLLRLSWLPLTGFVLGLYAGYPFWCFVVATALAIIPSIMPKNRSNRWAVIGGAIPAPWLIMLALNGTPPSLGDVARWTVFGMLAGGFLEYMTRPTVVYVKIVRDEKKEGDR